MKVFISNSKAGLSYLNLELHRPRAGIADYIIEVSTVGEYTTKLRIRGERDTVRKIDELARLIVVNMQEKGDKVHNWDSADIKHLSKLLSGPVKLMSSNVSITQLTFVTDALK